MRWLRLFAILLLLVPISHAVAVQPDEILTDPAKEARARVLSKQLRCMVCQNQSIDDSDAPLARDLRILVRERLQAGDSDTQVLDFLVQRYGEFVLLRPRLHWNTALLWFAAPVLLLVGGFVLVLMVRRRNQGTGIDVAIPQGGELTADEQRKLAGLLKSEDR